MHYRGMNSLAAIALLASGAAMARPMTDEERLRSRELEPEPKQKEVERQTKPDDREMERQRIYDKYEVDRRPGPPKEPEVETRQMRRARERREGKLGYKPRKL